MSRRARLGVGGLLLAGLLGLTACTGTDLAGLAQQLNSREVSSCLWYRLGGMQAGSFVGVTATGGTSLETCLQQRPGW